MVEFGSLSNGKRISNYCYPFFFLIKKKFKLFKGILANTEEKVINDPIISPLK